MGGYRTGDAWAVLLAPKCDRDHTGGINCFRRRRKAFNPPPPPHTHICAFLSSSQPPPLPPTLTLSAGSEQLRQPDRHAAADWLRPLRRPLSQPAHPRARGG